MRQLNVHRMRLLSPFVCREEGGVGGGEHKIKRNARTRTCCLLLITAKTYACKILYLLLLILQSFDRLAAFHPKLLQAILVSAV